MAEDQQGPQWVQLASSNINSVLYDPDSQILTVMFQTGDQYNYYAVPQSVYDGLTSHGSPGKYFYQNIRNVYRYD